MASPPGGWRVALPETLLVEGLGLAPHVVDRPGQPRRQDGQSLALAAFLLLLLLERLGPLAAAEEQARRLGEGPAQVGVADLVAAGAEHLARRLVSATHQPAVRQ